MGTYGIWVWLMLSIFHLVCIIRLNLKYKKINIYQDRAITALQEARESIKKYIEKYNALQKEKSQT